MKISWELMLIVLCLAGIQVGCGGGGGGGAALGPGASSAVVTLKTTGNLPSGVTALSGAYVDLAIPYGVAVPTNADGSVKSGAITPAGVLANGNGGIDLSFSSYSAPTVSKRGSLKFFVISTDLTTNNSTFGIGDFATVMFQITGTIPEVNDFTYNTFNPADLNLNPITVGSSLSFVVQ